MVGRQGKGGSVCETMLGGGGGSMEVKSQEDRGVTSMMI